MGQNNSSTSDRNDLFCCLILMSVSFLIGENVKRKLSDNESSGKRRKKSL